MCALWVTHKIAYGDNKMLTLHTSFELDRSVHSCTEAQNLHARLVSHRRIDLRKSL
jgi:hypothetical protein